MGIGEQPSVHYILHIGISGNSRYDLCPYTQWRKESWNPSARRSWSSYALLGIKEELSKATFSSRSRFMASSVGSFKVYSFRSVIVILTLKGLSTFEHYKSIRNRKINLI